MDKLISLMENSKKTLVFTGAGVSTLSGIRDFRGRGGFYTSDYEGLAVEDILSIDYFLRDPSIFYRWAGEFLYTLDDFEPSVVHTTLAKLEERGLIEAVYTQNIDLLHQKGGSKKVYEIHGSPANHHCLACKTAMSYAEVAPLVSKGELPHCPNCGKVVKPDVIFYGEGLDPQLLEQAAQDMAECDLIVVLGSSLTVQPAASFPMITHSNGGKIVIVNQQATPLDHYATLRYHDLGELFTDLEEYLNR
jgi:NAD-dependent deacetylase